MIRGLHRYAPLAWLRSGVALLMLTVAPLAMGADDPGAGEVTIEAMSAYIQGLSVGRADFVQINADGTQSRGVFSFRRPWEGRIDYSAPNEVIIIAAGRRVAVFDLRANSGPAIYPLSRTPLTVFMGQTIDLADGAHYRSSGIGPRESWIELGLRATGPETITLLFRHEPLMLGGWIYQDAQGQETAVILDRIRGDIRFPAGYFSIEQQTERLFPDQDN